MKDAAPTFQLSDPGKMSLEEQDKIYTASYSLYEAGKYEEASPLFTRLVLSNPFMRDYWKGLASCQQMAGQYKEALHAWALCALLEDSDPWAHFHAGECLLSLNEKEEALKALDLAEKRLGEIPSHEGLKDKIHVLKQVHFSHGRN